MTHSLHRYGTEESLQNDYTFIVRASEVNREDSRPKLQKILEIILSEGPVNLGCSSLEKSTASGLDIKNLMDSFGSTKRFACAFSSKEKIRKVLKKLKEADLGISVTLGGLINEIVEMCKEFEIKPHTANISLGILGGEISLIPDDNILSITTMCGHGLIASRLAESVIEKIKTGEMTPKEGSYLLAKHCPCGLFNMDRCEVIIGINKKKS